MLFLLNQEIIDLGDPWATLADLGVTSPNIPQMGKLVRMGQEAAYSANGIENAHLDVRAKVAAYLTLTGQVNCAIFVCPPKARSVNDVAVRLGQAPLTTMAYLLSQQAMGRLNAAMINQNVWRVAPSAASA